MKPIVSEESKVYFQEEAYTAINKHLLENNYSSIFILVDENTHNHCLARFLGNLETNISIEIIEIEAGEEHKNIETCYGVWQTLSELGGDRKSLLINIGGGVVTDLGGFVAATFKRGIDFVHVPTTLLAMVDASVGGKTGVDLDHLKNQVGVITQPKLVLIDPNYLNTLPEQEYRSGYAEILKHGLIKDSNYWHEVKYFITEQDIAPIIHHSVDLKNNVVLEDPYEQDVRKILNFGHTLGHAIESYCLHEPKRTKLLHGEAIAIGMILEGYLSAANCGLEKTDLKDIKKHIGSIYPKVNFSKKEIEAIIQLLIYDKKNSHGQINFVLLSEIGKCKIDINITNNQIFEAFDYYLS